MVATKDERQGHKVSPELVPPILTDAWLAESVEHAKDLTVGQRTAIAAEILLAVPKYHGQEKRTAVDCPTALKTGQTRNILAAMFHIGSRSIAYATAIRQADPELFNQLKLGEIEIYPAYKQIQHRVVTHRASPKLPATIGDPNVSTYWRNRGNRAYEVMADVLSRIHGLCRVVDEDFDLDLIRLKCTDKDLAVFASMAKWCAKTLNAFAAKTKEKRSETN